MSGLNLKKWRFFTGLLMSLSCTVLALAAQASEDARERLSQADQVSLVKVNRIGNLVNPAMTSRGMLAVEGLSYTVEVLKGWKGDHRDAMVFRVDFNDCTDDLIAGEQYLVFNRVNDDGALQTYQCSDLVPIAEASDLVAQLNALDLMSVAQHR